MELFGWLVGWLGVWWLMPYQKYFSHISVVYPVVTCMHAYLSVNAKYAVSVVRRH